MTGPGPIAAPPTDLPSVIGAAVEQLTLDPKAYGISWNLRIATVLQTEPLYAQFDGDPTSDGLVMTSMIGSLAIGARVYVLIVPPAGNFVCGIVGADSPMVSLDANRTGAGNATGGVTTTEVAIPSVNYAAEPIFTFAAKSVFEVKISGLLVADLNTDTVNIRVRKGQATITGTQLMSVQTSTQGGTSGQSFFYNGYFINSNATAVVSRLSLSIIRVAGAGAVYLFGPLIVHAIKLGTMTELPGLAINAATV